jgi:hypothetical protein
MKTSKITHIYTQKPRDLVSDVKRVVLQYWNQRLLHVASTQTAIIHLQKYSASSKQNNEGCERWRDGVQLFNCLSTTDINGSIFHLFSCT